jgi:RNA polymerase sigma factor (sigma-70 family)
MKSAELSDDELIRGCSANNRKSQEMLYRRYARSMYNLCLIYENDRDRAKDILQDAFVKIFRNIRCFDGKGSLKGWMRKIITNTAIDNYRKQCSEAQLIPIESVDQSLLEEEDATLNLNTNDIISQVNRLPEGARMIFRLHAIEGYSHKEIANRLHISVGTSKSQINRAKQLLQHWIAGYNMKPGISEGKK